MQVQYKKLSEIHPYERNPRRNDGAVDAVAESIRQFGWKVPIVIDSHGVIVTGHTRLKAAKKLGLDSVPCIVADDLTPEQVRAYRLADNKVAELATWNLDLLETELEGLDFGGFDFGFDTLIEERAERHEQAKERTQQAVCDILNLDKAQFEGVGKYDIPALKPVYELPEIREWIGFNYVLSDKEPEGKAVHFFVDDYQFERLWKNPQKYVEKLSRYVCVATPDFSPYGDMPLAAQIWNHYRKHWVGKYLQDAGLTVIPTLRPNIDPRFNEVWLEGEPEGGIVIMSSMWTDRKEDEQESTRRFNEVVERLHPKKVFIYGNYDLYPLKGAEFVMIPKFTAQRWGS